MHRGAHPPGDHNGAKAAGPVVPVVKTLLAFRFCRFRRLAFPEILVLRILLIRAIVYRVFRQTPNRISTVCFFH